MKKFLSSMTLLYLLTLNSSEESSLDIQVADEQAEEKEVFVSVSDTDEPSVVCDLMQEKESESADSDEGGFDLANAFSVCLVLLVVVTALYLLFG